MKNFWIAIAAALILEGCSTITPSINEYAIMPLDSVQETIRTPLNLSLKLNRTKSIDSLASKEIYYLRDTTQTGAYLYSRWADTPASMIERSLVSSLQNRHLFSVILPSTSTAYADRILESELHAFHHRFHTDGSSEGFVDITYRLIDSKSKKTIASKRFVIVSPASSADASGGVNALNVATQRLNQELIVWLENISKPKI